MVGSDMILQSVQYRIHQSVAYWLQQTGCNAVDVWTTKKYDIGMINTMLQILFSRRERQLADVVAFITTTHTLCGVLDLRPLIRGAKFGLRMLTVRGFGFTAYDIKIAEQEFIVTSMRNRTPLI